MRKFNFSNKIIPIWNSLQDYVVEISEIDTETKTEIIKNRTQFCMEGLWGFVSLTRDACLP